jgi:hypothetical protein
MVVESQVSEGMQFVIISTHGSIPMYIDEPPPQDTGIIKAVNIGNKNRRYPINEEEEEDDDEEDSTGIQPGELVQDEHGIKTSPVYIRKLITGHYRYALHTKQTSVPGCASYLQTIISENGTSKDALRDKKNSELFKYAYSKDFTKTMDTCPINHKVFNFGSTLSVDRVASPAYMSSLLVNYDIPYPTIKPIEANTLITPCHYENVKEMIYKSHSVKVQNDSSFGNRGGLYVSLDGKKTYNFLWYSTPDQDYGIRPPPLQGKPCKFKHSTLKDFLNKI